MSERSNADQAATPSGELAIERHIAAPVERTWWAWTTTEGMATWWWTHWDDTEHDVDCRVGGRYRLANPTVGIAVSGEYLAVEPQRRLGMTWVWEDADDGPGPVEHVEVRFAAANNGTDVWIRHSGPWETPDAADSYRAGWSDVLDALAASAVEDESPTLRVAREFIEAAERGDVDAARACFAPDAGIWHNYDRVTQTADENMRLLGWMAAKCSSREYDIARLIEIPGGYLQQHTLRVTTNDGVTVEADAAAIVTVVDGKITRIEEYLDPAPLAGLSAR